MNEESAHTTLPLAFTAAPIYDTNYGWLSQYLYCFDYTTVLNFFSRLAAWRLPSLSDANRLYLYGGAQTVDGYLFTVEEKYGYNRNPVFRLKYGSQTLVLEAQNIAQGDDLIEHTLAWLSQGYEWFLDQNQGLLAFPTFQEVTEPELDPSTDQPPSQPLSSSP